MKRISHINGLLKKIYRFYNAVLLSELAQRGFNDLRPSFLEILTFICETQGPSIKQIGEFCGLKKQTMTSHLNELDKRGYIFKKLGSNDKREQLVFLTEYGEKFKLNLMEAITELEKSYTRRLGEVELNRIELILQNVHARLNESPSIH